MAPAEELFVERGCGRLTMNMVLVGPEFAIAKAGTVLGDFVVPSLEVAGPGMHWVEVSRAIGKADAETLRMLEAYEEYHEVARTALRPGASASDVHRAVSKGFTERGYHLGHVTGHSIGMTMIEHPKLGEGVETELAAGMVFSMHPHAIGAGREGVPLHAGHVARHRGGRRAAVTAAPADLRRPGLGAATGADRLAELPPLEPPAAAGARGRNQLRPLEQRLQQRGPENPVHDQELHGHTGSIDRDRRSD